MTERWPYRLQGRREGVRSQPFRGGVGYSVAPAWLRKFGSIHSRNVDSKVVWNDIAHSCCWQLTKQGIRWLISHDLMAGSRFCPIEVTCFSFFTRTAHEISGVLIWTSGRTSDPKSQPFLQVRKAVTIELNYLKYLSSRCFSLIWVNRRQKERGFLGSISSKITLTKGEKERKPREKERARRKKEGEEKKGMVALS